ncbi:hypothetical protein, partial [Bacillus cereus]|uniref:hypothetical protein n=1 Tax=Bacillus cereus TaxID=1396 RepID=UPI000534F049
LDFSDEDDVPEHAVDAVGQGIGTLAGDIDLALARPRAERLRDGIRVVLAGPPNAGKVHIAQRTAAARSGHR